MTDWINAIKQWFASDQRAAARLETPGLAAYYWTGAAPVEHSVRDISMSGLYLETEERWYPGTVLAMTLQKKDVPEDSPERTIAVQSKAVRWGADGVGLEFVLPEGRERGEGRVAQVRVADRKSLERFLRGYNDQNGRAKVVGILPGSSDKDGGKPGLREMPD